MNEETKLDTQPDLAELLEAGHRSRMNGTMMQGLTTGNVKFHEIMPDDTASAAAHETNDCLTTLKDSPTRSTDDYRPESYLQYAAQLLEQMRGVYSTSWDNCSNGNSWNGGYNHFYNPCSGADIPQSHNCPVYDCTNTCGCLNPPPPNGAYPPSHDCGCTGGTATYYDDCAYKLQKLNDQINRIETMISEMYATNQQLFSYLIEYYNTLMIKNK